MENYVYQWTNAAIEYIPRVLQAILTLIIGFWIANQLGSALTKILNKRKVDPTVIPFLISIATVLFKVLVLVSVAGIFGVETASFVAILASAGLAVGLALQGSLGHFASGVLVLSFRPYKVGDLIKVNDFTGEVEQIQIFNTVLRTDDNKRIIIPNGVITSGPIVNITGQGIIRIDMQFLIAGTENIDKVRIIVREVADSCEMVLKEPAIDILIHGQDIGITKLDVRPWCKSEHYWEMYYYMQEHIKRQFVEKGIQEPQPSMDVTLAHK